MPCGLGWPHEATDARPHPDRTSRLQRERESSIARLPLQPAAPRFFERRAVGLRPPARGGARSGGPTRSRQGPGSGRPGLRQFPGPRRGALRARRRQRRSLQGVVLRGRLEQERCCRLRALHRADERRPPTRWVPARPLQPRALQGLPGPRWRGRGRLQRRSRDPLAALGRAANGNASENGKATKYFCARAAAR